MIRISKRGRVAWVRGCENIMSDIGKKTTLRYTTCSSLFEIF